VSGWLCVLALLPAGLEIECALFLSSLRSPSTPLRLLFLVPFFSVNERSEKQIANIMKHNFKANQKPNKNGKTATTHKSPGQICISPAGKTAKEHKKGPKPQLPFPNAFC
jgi:hypothetical protein